MIKFEKTVLDNGLTLLLHHDKNTPMVAVNTLFDVGAKDENPEKTGFAHLFEHLMFGGSINVENFDQPLQSAGGESNAFTSNDVTNYYDILPVNNLETALWLESDRLLSLAFTDNSLEVQRKVVIEEFKQRYLNQPYGDVWAVLREMCFKKHPYMWPTIGKEISHIEDATMQDVKDFFKKHYTPQNAILCVAGNIDFEETKKLVEKWYGDIPSGNKYERNLPQEDVQTESRKVEVERDVPYDAYYKAFPMCKKGEQDYYTFDLISDILSRGKSSRLYNALVKENQIFSDISAYVSGDMEKGLFIVSGKLNPDRNLEEADKAVIKQLELIKAGDVSENELTKVKNKAHSARTFGEQNILNKAMNLCFFELQGDANLVNQENDRYDQVTLDKIKVIANQYFLEEKSNTMFYKSNKK